MNSQRLQTQLLLHTHAADKLRSLGDPHSIIEFLHQLQNNPTETLPSYSEPDAQGREILVKTLLRYAILYFHDPYANLVKILAINNLETV